MDIHSMRYALSQAYAGPGWKKKVEAMPDDQVVAIYYRVVAGKPASRRAVARKDSKSTITCERIVKECVRTPYSFEDDGLKQLTIEDFMKG